MAHAGQKSRLGYVCLLSLLKRCAQLLVPRRLLPVQLRRIAFEHNIKSRLGIHRIEIKTLVVRLPVNHNRNIDLVRLLCLCVLCNFIERERFLRRFTVLLISCKHRQHLMLQILHIAPLARGRENIALPDARGITDRHTIILIHEICHHIKLRRKDRIHQRLANLLVIAFLLCNKCNHIPGERVTRQRRSHLDIAVSPIRAFRIEHFRCRDLSLEVPFAQPVSVQGLFKPLPLCTNRKNICSACKRLRIRETHGIRFEQLFSVCLLNNILRQVDTQ